MHTYVAYHTLTHNKSMILREHRRFQIKTYTNYPNAPSNAYELNQNEQDPFGTSIILT